MHSEYLTSALKPHQLPTYDLPEFAFVGRSNCGKSSLLNALLQHRDLARKSRTPGRTQMVNFFSLNNKYIFADLPGYGFSATGRDSRVNWMELMDAYFARPNIRYVLFLTDSRRKLDTEDYELLKYLGTKHPVLAVLTKTDKLNRSEQMAAQKQMEQELKRIFSQVSAPFLISSLKKTGINELRDFCLAEQQLT